MLDDPIAAPLRPPPPGFTLRRPGWADLRAVAGLFATCSLDRIGQVTVRPGDLEVRWLELSGFDDALLVERPDADPPLVAYADVQVDRDPWSDDLDVHVEGRVHPDWTGQGLAGFLLDRAEARALRAAQRAELDRVVLRTTVVDGDDAARAFFAGRGFTPVRHLLELRLDLHAPPPAPVWPDAVRCRTFAPGRDEEVAWRTHQAAFADVPTHLALDLDEWLEDRVRRDPAFDPRLTFLATTGHGTDNEVVGLAVCREGVEGVVEDGWIRDLGVLPAWRRRGIGIALLRTAFAAFRERGLTGVALEVDDVTVEGAVALYRRAGMRIVRRTDVVEKVLRLDDGPGLS
jgi:mycothiol synthase